jgi:hypothetical protein
LIRVCSTFKSSKNQSIIRELAEWFKAISLKLILEKLTSVRIGYSLYIRVRAGLVRRLIWVEEKLCSNHNDPKVFIFFNFKVYVNKLMRIDVTVT